MNHTLIILILAPLAAFGWSQKVTEVGGLFHFIRKIGLPKILRKPFYECTGCVAGQMALWYELSSQFTLELWGFDYSDYIWKAIVVILTILACIGVAVILEIKSLR